MERTDVKLSYDDYCLLPEHPRYELIEGDLLSVPSPSVRHQAISGNIELLLRLHVRTHALGAVFDAPLDVILDNNTTVQPDVVFVSQTRQSIIAKEGLRGAPDLIIEVLSPSTRTRDLELKSRLYLKYGVGEYWVIDPELQTVVVWLEGATAWCHGGTFGRGSVVTSLVLPHFQPPVDEIFA